MIECYVLVAAMLKFGMKSLEDTPSENVVGQNVWMLDNAKRKELLNQLSRSVISSFTDLEYHCEQQNTTSTDAVFEHSRQLLSIGMFYMYFRDAIKEGDGSRVVRCWRYMLPMFYFSSRKNYANEARTRITFFLSKLVAVAVSAIRLTVGETRLRGSPVLSNTDLNVSPVEKKNYISTLQLF